MALQNIFPLQELLPNARVRVRAYQTKSVPHQLVEELVAKGWSVQREGKTSVRLQRPKPLSVQFEDRVWALLYRMEFEFLSGPGGAILPLDLKNPDGPTNQLDIVGLDSELTLAIECKSAEKFTRRPQFQEELAKFVGFRERLAKTVNAQWPRELRRQTAMLFFLYNIQLSENDRERAKQENVFLFDEKDLEYYEKLVSQIGPAAKYQFFADMLPGKTVSGLEIRVPAVKTRMGAFNCYMFLISPEYLLKISYVSHRAKGKASDVNTYQRMIARNKLKSIRQYISEKGIFPTNIVVNLEKRWVTFHRAKQEAPGPQEESAGVIGWMHLRPAYKAAWIIDGQHRLFSYSGHPRAKSSQLAVLAFEGIPPSDQARLFVDINAKQKSVPPSLLQELYAELNWEALNPSIRVQAIVSKVVQVLDSDKDSPLFGRIRTADSSKDAIRCITLASLYSALDKQNFLVVRVSGNDVIEAGPLWDGPNERTLARSVAVIKAWLNCLKNGAPEWWALGASEGGGFAMNDSIVACVSVLKSVFSHLEASGRKLQSLNTLELVEAITPYGAALGSYFGRLTAEERKRYRDLRGSQGQSARTRRCQQVLRESFPKFNPPGLDEFIRSEKEQTNLKAKSVIDRIELMIKNHVVAELKQEFNTDKLSWWQDGVPKAIRVEVSKRMESDDSRRGEREAYFDLIDYRSIVLANWPLFQGTLGYGKKNESKDRQTKWMVEVNDWRNQVAHASSGVMLSVEALSQLEDYANWLAQKVNSIESGPDDSAAFGEEGP